MFVIMSRTMFDASVTALEIDADAVVHHVDIADWNVFTAVFYAVRGNSNIVGCPRSMISRSRRLSFLLFALNGFGFTVTQNSVLCSLKATELIVRQIQKTCLPAELAVQY